MISSRTIEQWAPSQSSSSPRDSAISGGKSVPYSIYQTLNMGERQIPRWLRFIRRRQGINGVPQNPYSDKRTHDRQQVEPNVTGSAGMGQNPGITMSRQLANLVNRFLEIDNLLSSRNKPHQKWPQKSLERNSLVKKISSTDSVYTAEESSDKISRMKTTPTSITTPPRKDPGFVGEATANLISANLSFH